MKGSWVCPNCYRRNPSWTKSCLKCGKIVNNKKDSNER